MTDRNNNHGGGVLIETLEILNKYCINYDAILRRLKEIVLLSKTKTKDEIVEILKRIIEDFEKC